MLSDPGGTSALGHCRALVLSSANWTASTPTTNANFGAQSHGPHTRCLRFAGWITPPPRKTRFRRLANLTGRDWLPAGSQRKVSGHPILLSQASPGAPKSKHRKWARPQYRKQSAKSRGTRNRCRFAQRFVDGRFLAPAHSNSWHQDWDSVDHFSKLRRFSVNGARNGPIFAAASPAA